MGRKAMDEWLDRELEELDAMPIKERPPLLIFSHIAPFIFDPEEEDEYFNLAPALRQELLDKFARRGAVGWFCGHFHRNAGGVYQHKSGQKLEVVVTAAVGTQIKAKEGFNPLSHAGMDGHDLGEEVSGFRVVDMAADGSFEHEWKTFADFRRERENGECERLQVTRALIATRHWGCHDFQ